MEAAAEKLHVYLPDVLALALSSMLDEVTDEQMDEYGSILGDPGDDRKGQLIHNYDAVHDYIQEQIAEHSLEEPPLFQKGYIDRHCLLYFNKKKARFKITCKAILIFNI